MNTGNFSKSRALAETILRLIVAGMMLVPALAVATEDASGSLPDERIAAGKELATTRSKGNCLACHAFDDGELPGNLGPPLMQMRLRFPDRSLLRDQIWDPGRRNPDTVMPPFGKHLVLTEEEIELIIDYLYTL
jgi:sulfur-oxidizing protein SoxX